MGSIILMGIALSIAIALLIPICFIVGYAAINLAIIFGIHVITGGIWHYIFVGLLINILFGISVKWNRT